MITLSSLLNPAKHVDIKELLSSLDTQITIKTSKGGGNSRKGIHSHKDNEAEIFIVLNGTARMEVDGKTIKLGKGEDDVDFLLTEGGVHGLLDKSPDFHCIIILLESKQKTLTLRTC